MKINGKKVTVAYEEKYVDDAMVIRDPLRLPKLKHVNEGYRVTLCQLLKAGRLQDGREFQELRIILEDS